MRGDLAAAVLHDPPLLYLDEPTIGLDVVAKARVRDFLLHVNRERGVTMLLATHDLADIEHLCRRMLVIDHGRLLYDGGVDDLRRRFGTHRTLVVDLDADDGAGETFAAPVHATLIKQDGPRRWLRFERDAISASNLIAEIAASHQLLDVAIEEPKIEEIVRRIYEEGRFIGPSGSDDADSSATLSVSSTVPGQGQEAKDSSQ